MKRKALFPGSFDPFTAGHLNILKRALTMFDEVVVAVGINIDKRGFFPLEKKMDIIRQATEGLEGVTIINYDNLTIDTCRDQSSWFRAQSMADVSASASGTKVSASEAEGP